MPAASSTESTAARARPAPPPAPADSGFRAHLRAHFTLKVRLTIFLTLLFCVPYFLIGYFPRHTPATLPLTALDRLIPFDPRFTFIYQSLYVFIPIAPFMARTRGQLFHYAAAFALLTFIGMLIFLNFPTLCPRPAVTGHSDYTLMTSYDPPTNAFPSMHVALATLSLALGLNILRDQPPQRRRASGLLSFLWLLAIAFATLATKQHYAVDLPAGALLALLSYAATALLPLGGKS